MLTKLETHVFKAFCNVQDYPGSDAWVLSIVDESKLDSKIVRGVLSNLIKKELVQIEDYEGLGRSADMVCVMLPKGILLAKELGYLKEDQIESTIDKVLEAKASNVTLEKIILHHVRADGPVTFQSIWAYCKEQFDNDIVDWDVAAEMNKMLKKGQIELGDDGESFDSV